MADNDNWQSSTSGGDTGELEGDYVCKYEYLDHTADVQLHAWGDDLKEAFEWCGIAMFGYMTDLNTVEIMQEEEINAEGHDLQSLLFGFLDELLFLFSAEPFLICQEVEIVEFDRENFKIKAICRGEPFDLSKHPQGTEVKAITYSNMQIYDEPDQHEIRRTKTDFVKDVLKRNVTTSTTNGDQFRRFLQNKRQLNCNSKQCISQVDDLILQCI